jgi:predicted GNAT family acetyltransferase
MVPGSTVPEKLRYEIDLSNPVPIPASPVGLRIRTVSPPDLARLARLMLDAYVGTIDFEDEDLDDAMEEVRSFLDDDASLLDRSYLVEDDGQIVSAVLVSMAQGRPFIGYVMTLPSHKKQGLARLGVTHVLKRLADDGHESVVLYITEGNTPSEGLFRSVGAVQVRT